MPTINGLATALTGFEYSDETFQMGLKMYPGQDWCKLKSPHTLWHHQSAIGLVDLVLLADQMDIIFGSHLPQTNKRRQI